MKKIIIKIITNSTFLTVISGVSVYVLSQMLMEYILNPIKDYRKIKRRIGYYLSMYCRYYNNPYNLLIEKDNSKLKNNYKKASLEIRKVACEFSECIGKIIIIKEKTRENLNKVLDSLIGLSNGFFIQFEDDHVIKDNKKYEIEIRKILKLNRSNL